MRVSVAGLERFRLPPVLRRQHAAKLGELWRRDIEHHGREGHPLHSVLGPRDFDRHHVVVSALKALADDGVVDVKQVAEAIKRYEIDASAPMPTTV